MKHEIKKYLFDIKKSIKSIFNFLGKKRDFNIYQESLMLRRATEREIEIIGEAVNRILKIDPEFPLENSRKIVDTRNWVIHAYDNVDNVIIWGIITNHLPKLLVEVEELLNFKIPKIKICGMKHPENIQEVALLQPDYLGFIFYEKSPRNFTGEIPEISNQIKKTGVFVDAEIDFIVEKVEKYNFKAVQLHGNETAEYCGELKKVLSKKKPVRFENSIDDRQTERSRCSKNQNAHFDRTSTALSLTPVEVFKVFGIKDKFDFSTLKPYEGIVDYFLFDTKGKEKGGNGYTFDWSVLKNYKSKTPIILSGGIGIDELNKIEQILKTDLPIYALDLNSKFETEPGKKEVKMLEEFLEKVKNFDWTQPNIQI